MKTTRHLIISRSVLLTTINVSDKICRENQTHIILNNFFFFENHTFYETKWKNIVERGRPRMTVWPIRVACWKTKAVGTHSEFVILIAFPLQLWLYERASNVTLYVHCCFVCVCVCVVKSHAEQNWPSCYADIVVRMMASHYISPKVFSACSVTPNTTLSIRVE